MTPAPWAPKSRGMCSMMQHDELGHIEPLGANLGMTVVESVCINGRRKCHTSSYTQHNFDWYAQGILMNAIFFFGGSSPKCVFRASKLTKPEVTSRPLQHERDIQISQLQIQTCKNWEFSIMNYIKNNDNAVQSRGPLTGMFYQVLF